MSDEAVARRRLNLTATIIGAPVIAFWLYYVCEPLRHVSGRPDSWAMAILSIAIAAGAIALIVARTRRSFETNKFVWNPWVPWGLYAASMVPIWWLIIKVWDDLPPLGYMVQGMFIVLVGVVWWVVICTRHAVGPLRAHWRSRL